MNCVLQSFRAGLTASLFIHRHYQCMVTGLKPVLLSPDVWPFTCDRQVDGCHDIYELGNYGLHSGNITELFTCMLANLECLSKYTNILRSDCA